MLPQLLGFVPQPLILTSSSAPLLLNQSDLGFSSSITPVATFGHVIAHPERNISDTAGFVQLKLHRGISITNFSYRMCPEPMFTVVLTQ